MSFSAHHPADFKSGFSSTSYCEKQLKVAVADQGLVRAYEDAMMVALTEEPEAAISVFLKLMNWRWEQAKELVLFGLQTLLADRCNPNQTNKQGFTPLYWIFHSYDLDFLMLMLAYHANPFLKPARNHFIDHRDLSGGFSPQPPIQYAMLPERIHHYDFIAKRCVRPERTPSTMMRIDGYTVKNKNGRIHIHFETNIKPFSIQIVPTKKLSEKEIAFIYEKYKKHFSASPTLRRTLDDFFQYEIKGQSKLIELLFCGETFVGMHLHKIFQDSRYPNCHSHYISCAYVDKEFCGLGLSDPLIMTLPSLMPKLFSSKLIMGSLQAIFIGAVNLLKGLEFFPKYRSDFFAKYARDHFEHVQEVTPCDPNPILVNDRPGECWSELPVHSLADAKKPADELLLDEIFFNWQRGIRDTKKIIPNKHRGVFCVFSVDDEFINKYFISCAKRLKLNGGKYLNDVAPQVATLIPEFKPQFTNKAVTLPDHGLLFQGVIAPSNTKIPAKKVLEGLFSRL